jgi:hypothetical protein
MTLIFLNPFLITCVFSNYHQKEDHKEEVANKVNDNREGCAIENEWDNTIYLRGKGLCDLKEDSSS